MGINHGVDAHQFAPGVDQRAPGITPVDGRIGLDEAFDGVHAAHRTGFRAHDAGRHGGSQVERVAHGQHPFADFQLVGIAHGQGREVLAFDFDQRQVGLFVRPDDAPFKLPVVVQLHQQFVGLAHHMVVGDDITVGRNNHTRAGTFAFRRLDLPALCASAAESEEIPEEIRKRVLHLHRFRLAVRGHFDIYHGIDRSLRSLGQIHQARRSRHRGRLRPAGRINASHHTEAPDEQGRRAQHFLCCLFHCFYYHIVDIKGFIL